MATIKQWTVEARDVRENAKAIIDELKARIRQTMQERDARLIQIKAEIELIRNARNAKMQANQAKRDAKDKARKDMEDRLRKQAWEEAAKKAKMAAAKCHPDAGGTSEEFRAAWRTYEMLKAQAASI